MVRPSGHQGGQTFRGVAVMLSGNRHWLEYDSVALVVLFGGIGFVALIVLGI
jgi:hypothetical protein